jgi:hypothetical protein
MNNLVMLKLAMGQLVLVLMQHHTSGFFNPQSVKKFDKT